MATIGGLVVNNPLAIQPGASAPSAPAPAPKPAQGVYWVGADNNLYTRVSGQNGVKNIGPNGVAALPSGLSRIDDPNAPKSNPKVLGAATGVAPAPAPAQTSAPQFQDRSNDIAVQNSTINEAQDTGRTGVQAIQDALAKIMGQYSSVDAAGEKQYGDESTANQQDLQSNKQTALETAQQGRRGLFGTLASLGALSGTGLELANNAVARGANEDLTQASDTYATNQNGLDSSIEAYRKDEAAKEDQARYAAENDKKIAQSNALKAQQAAYKNLVADYQDEGNTAQGKFYTDLISKLAPQISAVDVPQIDLGYTGGAYTAPTLQSYLGKANTTTVSGTPATTTGGNPYAIPGLVASLKKQAA